MRRRCPLCDRETDDKVCPDDRMATLLATTFASNTPRPSAGDVIAERYQLEESIGQGGYGQVFRARHLGTGQDVAVKVLIPQGGDETFTIKRFFLEARATSGLKHANTIKVFDFGQEDSGLVFLAMELLSGCTLRQEMRGRKREERPFTEREAIDLGIAITRSLGEAHAAGLVHRDLKPDNIFLHQTRDDDEPTIKVLDFGIVKLGDGQHTLSSNTSVPGTPAYMSPEHALNQHVDARSDLYSLGVILYQLVTLDLPFKGESDPQTLYMHAYHPLPSVADRAKTPLSLQFVRVVTTALAKRRDERFRDAREMRDALRACLDDAIPSRPSQRVAPSTPLDGALQMVTPHADSHLMPALDPPSRKWERGAMIAGIAGLVFSAGAVLIAVRGERTPKVESTPLPVTAAVPAVPEDAGVAAPDASAAVVEETPPPLPRKAQRAKLKKKRTRTEPPPPPPPAPEEKRDILKMRIEELVEPPK